MHTTSVDNISTFTTTTAFEIASPESFALQLEPKRDTDEIYRSSTNISPDSHCPNTWPRPLFPATACAGKTRHAVQWRTFKAD